VTHSRWIMDTDVSTARDVVLCPPDHSGRTEGRRDLISPNDRVTKR
jgi:hypothetical protein